jgi:hypothetical protein
MLNSYFLLIEKSASHSFTFFASQRITLSPVRELPSPERRAGKECELKKKEFVFTSPW